MRKTPLSIRFREALRYLFTGKTVEYPVAFGAADTSQGAYPEVDETFLKAYAEIGTLHAAARRVALDLASVPLTIRKKKPGGGSVVLDPEREEVAKVFATANPAQGKTSLWSTFWLSMQATGEGALLFDRGIVGIPGKQRTPKAIRNLRTDLLTPIPGPTGSIVRYDYALPGRAPIPLGTDEVYLGKYPNLTSEHRGLAPFTAAKVYGELESQSSSHWRAFFKNGTRLGGAIETEHRMSPSQVDEWEKKFEEKAKGLRRFWRTLLLPNGMKLHETGLNPRDADFVNLFKIVREQQLSILGVPPALVGVFEFANYANSEQQIRIYWQNTIIPNLTMLEEDLTEIVLPWWDASGSLFAKYDIESVPAMQELHYEKAKKLRELVESGLLTLNRAREILGEPRVIGGDTVYVSSILQPVGIEVRPSARSAAAAISKFIDTPERREKRAKVSASLDEFERDATKEIEDLFSSQIERIARAVEGGKAIGRKAVRVEEVWDDEFESSRTESLLIRIMARVTGKRGQDALDEVDAGEEFLISDPEVSAFIEENAAEQVRRISDATKEFLRELLVQADREGLTVQEIAALLRDPETFAFSKARANRIARTETVRAYNYATDAAWKQASDLVSEKEWLTAGDERVRDSHAVLDGEKVGVEERFSNGLRYPGDPIGTPGETVNCRCTLSPVLSPSKRYRIVGFLGMPDEERKNGDELRFSVSELLGEIR